MRYTVRFCEYMADGGAVNGGGPPMVDTLEVITSDNGTEGKEALDECET